ncbi:MAG: amidohydrolase [Clostridia bacterium]|nr:amidohydrolase [Clostridia bacterium]
MSILIKNVSILFFDSEEELSFSEGDVFVKGDIIESVGKKLDVEADVVIDGRDKVALPGFVNAHTHAAMALFRGYADDLPLDIWLNEKIWPVEAKLTPEDVYWGVKLALLEMIKGGITAYGDMYFFMDEEAEAVTEAGIRASLSVGLIAVAGDPSQKLREAEHFVSRWNGEAEGRITAMFGPHAPYTCPPGFLKEVVSAAKQYGVGIHTHLAETKKEVEDIYKLYGKSPVEVYEEAGVLDLHVLAAHCVHMTSRDMEILKNHGVFVVHNPQSNLKLGSGIAPVPEMLKKGIPVALGTDGAASNNNLDIFEEMRTAALLHKGVNLNPTLVTASEALKMATIWGAEALGLKNVGKIEPGKKADIVLLDFNSPHLQPKIDHVAHIVYSAGSADVDTVIVDGKIIMKNGKVLTLDEEKIYQEVQKRTQRLISN